MRGWEASQLPSANTSAAQTNLDSGLSGAEVASATRGGQLCPAPGRIPRPLSWPAALVTAFLSRRELTASVSFPASCVSRGTCAGGTTVPGAGWAPVFQGLSSAPQTHHPSPGPFHRDLWSAKGRGGARWNSPFHGIPPTFWAFQP